MSRKKTKKTAPKAAPPAAPSSMWAPMVFRAWEGAFRVGLPGCEVGVGVRCGPGDAIGFIPVFATREAAAAAHPGARLMVLEFTDPEAKP